MTNVIKKVKEKVSFTQVNLTQILIIFNNSKITKIVSITHFKFHNLNMNAS
jgi:hypothetical protein